MAQNQIVPFVPRPRPVLDGPGSAARSLPAVSLGTPRDVKKVIHNLYVDVVSIEATGVKTGEAQRVVGALYQHGIHCLEGVYVYGFARAKAHEDEDVTAYLLGTVHQYAHMANEDVGDITRLGAAGIKLLVERSVSPEQKGRA